MGAGVGAVVGLGAGFLGAGFLGAGLVGLVGLVGLAFGLMTLTLPAL